MTAPYTYTMQRYAAEIYRLQEFNAYVTLSELAEQVDASLQAVSRMLVRLHEGGYIVREPYHGVRLTPAGEQIAMPAIRRHRLSELFLVRVLGFGWDEVHYMTDTFEQGVDEVIEDRIYETLGRPTRCPHGEPIPSKAGVIEIPDDASLVDLPEGQPYTVSRVRIHDPEKLHYLGEFGLFPTARFLYKLRAPFNGPVRIKIGNQEVILSYEMATGLYVIPG